MSIDWDYFIRTPKENWGSYAENASNVMNLWYKRYIQAKARGKDIQKSFQLSQGVNGFWEKIRSHFRFTEKTRAFVSDSHALSYYIARQHGCDTVYLFDAHADLGYGGLSSLDFEVNCANWLGKLLKEKRVKEANIIYSPYTAEKPEFFRQINNAFNVRYMGFDSLDTGIEVSEVHICRSGAWTPPWLDGKFLKFVDSSGLYCELTDCPARKWDTTKLSLSDQIYYLLA